MNTHYQHRVFALLFAILFGTATGWGLTANVSFVYAQDAKPKPIMLKLNSKDKPVKLYNQSYALIIGVSDYTNGWPSLPGVKNDVVSVKNGLEKQGFKVVVAENPTSEQLPEVFSKFINKYGLEEDARLLLYFAGHGHTIKQSYGGEMGYIIPTDAANPNANLKGFLSRAMSMQQIEVYARQIQAKHALFVFDACFSGSIFALSRAIPENISYKTAKPVRQFISSGSASEQVPDKSIFAQQFMAGISGEADGNADGFITGIELGEFLQSSVVNYSKNMQHPQYGKIRDPNLDKGDFVFQSPLGANQTKSSRQSAQDEDRADASASSSSGQVAEKSVDRALVAPPPELDDTPQQQISHKPFMVFAGIGLPAGDFALADPNKGGYARLGGAAGLEYTLPITQGGLGWVTALGLNIHTLDDNRAGVDLIKANGLWTIGTLLTGVKFTQSLSPTMSLFLSAKGGAFFALSPAMVFAGNGLDDLGEQIRLDQEAASAFAFGYGLSAGIDIHPVSIGLRFTGGTPTFNTVLIPQNGETRGERNEYTFSVSTMMINLVLGINF